MPENILTEGALTPLKIHLGELNNFTKKYPQSSRSLKQYSLSVSNSITNFNRGYLKHNGNWITPDSYKHALESEHLKKKAELERIAKAKKDRLEFEAAQRAKGLVQYKGAWMTKEQMAEQLKKEKISKYIRQDSLINTTWTVFQIIEDGEMLVESDSGVAHIIDAGNFNAVSDQHYNNNLYYCGTYTYTNKLGDLRRARSYCLDYDTAYAIVERRLYPTKGSADDEAPRPNKIADRKGEEAILEGASSGSGFFVGTKGYFVTNHHVIDGGKRVKIHHAEELLDAKIITSSKIADLALLKVNKEISGLPLSDVEANVGSNIYTIGFPNPRIQGLSPKVTKGVISSSRGLQQDNTVYQIDASIQPGNSGGPICDEAGLVVGVVVSKLNELHIAKITGSLPQNVNYAIKSSEVMALLRSKGINLETGRSGKSEKSGPAAIQDAIAAVGLVIVR